MAKNRLFGVGEPLTIRALAGEIDAMEAIDLIDAVGFGAFREWMHIPVLLSDPETLRPEAYRMFTKTLDRMAEKDIEVTGMSHEWFLPEGCRQRSGCAAPKRDLTPGSLYMQMLEMLSKSWETIARAFPQVPMWEVGNEWGANTFLHPDGFREDNFRWHFTQDEKADIAVDLMFWSAQGIRKGNPNAKVVSFSPCRVSEEQGGDLPYYLPANYAMAQLFDRIYSRIQSGKYWSTNTDDYFDAVAYHPYVSHDVPPDDLWKDVGDAVHRVMEHYGDGRKQALITEFGYTDIFDAEKERRHAEYYRDIFRMCGEMPYLRTLHVFRLYEQYSMLEHNEPNSIGGAYEVTFGIFTEPNRGQLPRQKAIELQKLAGGTGDLYMHRKDR